MTIRRKSFDMSNPKIIQTPPNATVIFGKPAQPCSEETLHRISSCLAGDETILEAHLPMYFVLGSMPAPRLSLVLVTRGDSQRESVALRARSILADVLLAQPVPDIWVMDSNDRLLSSVRHAGCQIQKRAN
jgi:hypothetical protein